MACITYRRIRFASIYSNFLARILYVYSIEPEAGILYKDFLGEDAYPMPLLELYSSFDEYEEIALPWLFEETFEEVRRTKFEPKNSFVFSWKIDQTKC